MLALLTVAVARRRRRLGDRRQRRVRLERRVRRAGGADPRSTAPIPAAAQAGIAAARAALRHGRGDRPHAPSPCRARSEPLDVRDQDPNGTVRPADAAPCATGRYPTAAGEVALTRGAADLLSAPRSARPSTLGDGATGDGRRHRREPDRPRRRLRARRPGHAAAPPSSLHACSIDLAPRVRRAPARCRPRAGRPDRSRPAHGAGSDKQAGRRAAVLVAVDAGHGARRACRRRRLRRRRPAPPAPARPARRHRRHRPPPAPGHGGQRRDRRRDRRRASAPRSASSAGCSPRPAVESAADHRIDRFDLPWTLDRRDGWPWPWSMATVAAWWPARTASRLPVMAALSGRPARPKPVHRSLLVALVLVGGGIAGDRRRPTRRATTCSRCCSSSGCSPSSSARVFAAPAAIRVARRARPAAAVRASPRAARPRPLPGPGRRRAGRDHARARRSPSPSSVWRRRAQHRSDEGNLSDRELLIQVGDPLHRSRSRPHRERAATNSTGGRPPSSPRSAPATRPCPSTSPSTRRRPTTRTLANRSRWD